MNICFHGVGNCRIEREAGESRYWVSSDYFLRILDELAGRNEVRISFDDGNRSDATIALPALQERGLHATFFVLAGRFDDPDSLDRADVRALHAAGMTIGTHGWSHVPWRGLSSRDLNRESAEARQAIAEVVAQPVREAALPLGRYDRRLLRELRRQNYDTVYTSDRFPSREGSWLQARFSVTASDSPETMRALLTRHFRATDAIQAGKSIVKRIR
jgi:peptidoglycan/xylan/chitin deacetylase (PgdA/CDA1 family)